MFPKWFFDAAWVSRSPEADEYGFQRALGGEAEELVRVPETARLLVLKKVGIEPMPPRRL